MPPKRKPGKKADAAAAEAEAAAANEQAANQYNERQILRPDDQEDLTEAELNEEITRILYAKDPNTPDNITRFNFREKSYKPEATVDHTAFHFCLDGSLIHRESDEAKRQLQAEETTRETRDRDEGVEEGEEGGDGHKALRNQFNFSERASQTYNNPKRDKNTATEPPPTCNFAANATQWEIYDAYILDIENNKKQETTKKGNAPGKSAAEETPKEEAKETKGEEGIYSAAMSKSLKIIERMVNLNTFDDIAQDFKYWEDASDVYREGEGTLLPLWKFQYEKAKKKHVTALCWSPEYPDLFAVGYGSYDFLKQGTGLICCFSLKNPSYPEYACTTETGVMSLDFHPQHSSLLAVGLYDGTVMVYDIRTKANRPIFQSTIKTGKHTDPVWQVSWQEEDLAKNLNFFSISSDGRVTLWTMSKNELQYTDVMELKLVGQKDGEPDDESSLCGLAGGTCFDFNKTSEHLFIVGTEEGRIHKCSKAYNSQYLETYEGHHMAVYGVRWNTFHPNVFLSASADWTVKLWDHNHQHPIMSFDLQQAVGDVAWAPYSSTVMAAVTSDGKVHVFDLHENKHEAMCEQKVVRKAKLTRVCFNPKEPILLVGDDRGAVTSLKLSPNLRKIAKDESEGAGDAKASKKPKKGGGDDDDKPKKTQRELEIEKLEKIISIAEKGDAAL
eukprot:GFYU01001289.1.p1 GENE.GFYU01001289.1~~GFYU01001289.1.p1  ORF type:complete len:672 (+),score=254.71 GFYU01001289.1:267-2282(+)